jgi:electron transport complex protein RnfD
MSRYNQGTLIVSSSPHILDNINTTRIMLDVIIALVPAFIMSGVVFGPRAILLTITCVASCVVFEWAFEKVTKKENTITDLSAVVTGILLGFNLPSSLPYWMAVIGSFVAIVVVKQLFGGIGQNFANPAITARIVLMLSFATPMTTWPLSEADSGSFGRGHRPDAFGYHEHGWKHIGTSFQNRHVPGLYGWMSR